ncbi:MAG: hypothetical protein CSB46_11205, partial [Micrococcales bacterium]
MLAHAFLSVLAATQPGPTKPHHNQLIPLTRNEIRRLLTAPTATLSSAAFPLAWSTRRRTHQATTRHSHHKRRTT